MKQVIWKLLLGLLPFVFPIGVSVAADNANPQTQKDQERIAASAAIVRVPLNAQGQPVNGARTEIRFLQPGEPVVYRDAIDMEALWETAAAVQPTEEGAANVDDSSTIYRRPWWGGHYNYRPYYYPYYNNYYGYGYGYYYYPYYNPYSYYYPYPYYYYYY